MAIKRPGVSCSFIGVEGFVGFGSNALPSGLGMSI